MKSFSELSKLETYEERFSYLKLEGSVGDETFGGSRYLNQSFYRSKEWKEVRDRVIVRDNGCDLGILGHEISSKPIVHHINPITKEQIENHDPALLDMENLVTVGFITHDAIHYGDDHILTAMQIADRKPGDTKLW